MAEKWLEESGGEPEEKPYEPLLDDFTPEVAELVNLRDAVAENTAATMAAAGGNPPRVRPAKRPRTAWDRAMERARFQRHLELVSEVEEAQERYVQRRASH